MAPVFVVVVAALLGTVACGNTERDPQAPTAGVSTPSGGETGLADSGVGGSAAEPAKPTPVDECQDYCDTLAYQLPSALCEDWNYLNTPPEFCLREPVASCAEQCEVVYQTVSPACAAALPAAIDCVAPTYADFGVPPLTECWLHDCRAQLFDLSSACYGLRDALQAARAAWDASEVSSYGLRYVDAQGTEVQVTVRANGESLVTPSNATAWTVPALFDEVERILDTPGIAPQVEYDADFGHVTMLKQDQGCDSQPIVSGAAVAPLP